MSEKLFTKEEEIGSEFGGAASAVAERPADAGQESSVREVVSAEAESTAAAEKIEEDNDIAALLQAAETIINTPLPRDPAEIDAKAAEYEKLEARLKTLPDINESRLARVEKIEQGGPKMMDSYYERLQNEKVSPQLLGRHKQVGEALEKMKETGRKDTDFIGVLDRLVQAENELRSTIEQTILGAATEEFQTKVAEVRASVDRHYEKRANELQAAIQELKNDPEVMKRHGEQIAEREAQAWQKELARCEAVLKWNIPIVQSLEDRQKQAITRIEQIGGSLKGQAPAEVRRKLIESVLLGEKKSGLSNPSEVTPWKSSSAIRYIPEMKRLRDEYNFTAPHTGSDIEHLAVSLDATKELKEKSSAVLEQIRRIIDTDRLLQDILGKEWEYVRGRDGKQYPRQTEFYAAFGKREKNDKEGKTKQLREARAEADKRAVEINAELKKVSDKGGVTGTVYGAALRELDAQRRYYPNAPGAVLFEAKKSKKGNPYLEVVETAGAAKNLFKKGTTFSHIGQIPQGFQLSLAERGKLEEKLSAARRA